MKPTKDKNVILTKDEMRAINDAMPAEAKYGDVFEEIAKHQIAKLERLGYHKESKRR